jgi:antitoxin component YwqK of YwqJK toxin-antitoxin module
MKFRLTILVSVLLIISCKEEKSKTLSVSVIKTETELLLSNFSSALSLKSDTLFFNSKKLKGVVYELYENGDTLSTISFANGIQDGISKKWYSNKQLMEVRYYKLGQKNGKQIAYFENGKKKFEFVAINDIYEGEMKEWNVEGNLIHLATYKNGQEEGSQKMWYDNGKIRANYVIKNGKRYGLLGTKNCKNVSDSIFVVK